MMNFLLGCAAHAAGSLAVALCVCGAFFKYQSVILDRIDRDARAIKDVVERAEADRKQSTDEQNKQFRVAHLRILKLEEHRHQVVEEALMRLK